MNLQTLQTQFQRHLLAGDAAIAQAIRGGGIGADRRLAVYHHAYRMRLVDTLRDSYGHTLVYLGDSAFNEAALSHVESSPSHQASLRWYGESFPLTLAARFEQRAEVAELATLDWALRHAFDGPDAVPLTLADLAALAPEAWGRIGFGLHPTYTRLRLSHNTLAVWQALDQDEAPPPAVRLAVTGDLLVWRRGHQPHFRSLQALEAAALDRLHAGWSFAQTCEELAVQHGDPDMAALTGTLLRRWVDEELLCAVIDPLCSPDTATAVL